METLPDRGLLRLLMAVERAIRGTPNHRNTFGDDELRVLAASPYVRAKLLPEPGFIRGLTDAGWDKLDELAAKYPAPTNAASLIVRSEVDLKKNTITYFYTWPDSPIVMLPVTLLDRSTEIYKNGGLIRLGTFNCRVIWESEYLIYAERISE